MTQAFNRTVCLDVEGPTRFVSQTLMEVPRVSG